MKLNLLDEKALFNANIFYYDYSDYQSFLWVNNSGLVENHDADFKGLELELFLTASNGLDVILNTSYTDAKEKNLEVASGIFADTTPAFTPEYQASVMIRYNWDWNEDNIAAQFSANYQSETFHNARNFTAHEMDAYVAANARLTWTDSTQLWSATAYVDNMFNSEHEIMGFDVTGFYGTTQISYAKPRVYGITVKRNF